MIDSGFLVTLGIIFLMALFGSHLRSRHRDRCLRGFDGYHVTVEKKNGQIIWGEMHLESTGIELEYPTDVQDQAHIETSYLLYKSEYGDLQAIYRYADELTPGDRRRRERDLRRSFHPGLVRILARKLRNFVSTATDSLSEAITLITGQARKPAVRYLSEKGEAYLNKLGKDIIGYVGTSFDPLLEEYVGAKVVVEVAEGDAIYEHTGVLKEYSADFLEILDVFYPQVFSVHLGSPESRDKLTQNIRIAHEDGAFKIHNLGDMPLLLHKIKCRGREGEINAVIGPGDEIELQNLNLAEARTEGSENHLAVFFESLSKAEEDAWEATPHDDVAEVLTGLLCGEVGAENVEFDFKVIRVLDMIVPREHALIRHKAERYDPDNVLGEFGLAWIVSDEDKEDEKAYREALLKNPGDVASCLGLARLLVQRGEYEKTVPLLERALEHRDDLVDHGRLVELQLQAVRRKLAERQPMAR